jgi:hypothetical protein
MRWVQPFDCLAGPIRVQPDPAGRVLLTAGAGGRSKQPLGARSRFTAIEKLILKLLAATAVTLTRTPAKFTIITVENSSTKASASVPVMCTGYEVLHRTLAPTVTSSVWKSGGKVLVPHDYAAAAFAVRR